MAAGLAICLVCGEPLDYFEEAQEVTCHICGKKETGHSICTAGHYVCDACHRAGGVDWVMDYCARTTSKNPIEIAQAMMADKSIFPNGPEHHTLVGAALMVAYANAGGEVDLEKALAELKKRSLQVPGGTCGFWGTCGAATSAGQFYSIISGSTPMTRTPWAETQRLTSRILGRLADLGGPRCCKRTGFTAIQETATYVEEIRGVHMEMPERIVCTHSARNKECLRGNCPFYPGE
ncbi:MAG: DUF5714 domain-containing protein [Eggerthellaceae bacterium]|nr:DUF5714 domain-containing protein [Eggerthellaceae bacterium]